MTHSLPLRMKVCLVTIGVAVAALQSCAPVFSELQSARTVGKNRIELTPSYSTVNYTEEGEGGGVQDHLGVQAAFGLSKKVDIRARFERIWLKDNEDVQGISVAAIGPKIGLLENRIAVSLPFGRALGEETKESWGFHPTLLFTLPAVKDKVDITLAPKYLISFCEDCEDLVAVNFGVSISSDLSKWAIRPEYGLLYNPGETGHFGQFSIGFSAAFGKSYNANNPKQTLEY